MGTTLTGTTPQDTYDSLIKVTDNGPLSGALKALSDGLGNDSTLSLSTTAASIAGTLAVSGASTFSSAITMALGGTPRLTLQDTDAGAGNVGILFQESTSPKWTLASNSGSFQFFNEATSSNAIWVSSTNNVGIGTSDPAAPLHINVSDTAGVSTLEVARFGMGQISDFGDGVYTSYFYNTSTEGARIGMDVSIAGGNLYFNANGAERMRITAAGSVGIGTSAPESGNGNVGRVFQTASTGNTSASIVASTAGTGLDNAGIFEVRATAQTSGTGRLGQIYFGRENTSTTALSGYAAFSIANAGAFTERVRLTSDGYLRMATGSAGIQFNGDTAAAIALDDYEEGAWTMGVSFGGASAGVTTLANTGTYTKIGRQVTAVGYIALTSKGSSTGQARVTGLPFTIANGSSFEAAAACRIAQITFADFIQINGNGNATTLDITEVTNAGVITTLNDADFANNSEIFVSITYFV